MPTPLPLAGQSDRATESVREVSVISCTPPSQVSQLGELWCYRDLLWRFSLRDLRLRYRQTVVGAGWAVIQPLATMALFSGLFHGLGKTPSDPRAPYSVSAYCGLLAWQLFSFIVAQGSLSLLASQALISKVYFPRLLLPVSPALTGLVDFTVAFVVLIALVLCFGLTIDARILLLPAFVIPIVGTALAIAVASSAVSAIYRDLRFVVPFALQAGFLLSPVIYETGSIVPSRWQIFYSLNPLVPAIEGIRWAVLGTQPPGTLAFVVSVVVMCVAVRVSLNVFWRLERELVDRV